MNDFSGSRGGSRGGGGGSSHSSNSSNSSNNNNNSSNGNWNSCPRPIIDFYPIVQDLSEVEVGNFCDCTNLLGGMFDLQNLAYPAMKPVQILQPQPLQQKNQKEQAVNGPNLDERQRQEHPLQKQQLPQHEKKIDGKHQTDDQHDGEDHPQQQQTQNKQQQKPIPKGQEQEQKQEGKKKVKRSSWSSPDTKSLLLSDNSINDNIVPSTSAVPTLAKKSFHRRLGSGILANSKKINKIIHHKRGASLGCLTKNLSSSILAAVTSTSTAAVPTTSTIAATVIDESCNNTFDGFEITHHEEEEEKETSIKFHDIYVLTVQIFRCRKSNIWECIHRKSGIRYCVKIFDKRSFSMEEERIMNNEIDIYKKILLSSRKHQHQQHHPLLQSDIINNDSHANLSKCIDIIYETNHTYLVLEYMPGGNLLSKIIQEENNNSNTSNNNNKTTTTSRNNSTNDAYKRYWSDEKKVKQICRSIVNGLYNLHSVGICHGDIQPQNILLKESNHSNINNMDSNNNDSLVRIADFGCAMIIRQQEQEYLERQQQQQQQQQDYNNDKNKAINKSNKKKKTHKQKRRYFHSNNSNTSDISSNSNYDEDDETTSHSNRSHNDDYNSFSDDMHSIYNHSNCNTAATNQNNEDNNTSNGNEKENIIKHRMATIRFGNASYTAPEILKGSLYDTQADMWSLGVVIYFCLSGGISPFVVVDERNGSKKFSFKKIYKADYSFTPVHKWAHISRQAKQFISNLLHVDPQVRMTAEEALQHKWLQQQEPSGEQQQERNHQIKCQSHNLFHPKQKSKQKEVQQRSSSSSSSSSSSLSSSPAQYINKANGNNHTDKPMNHHRRHKSNSSSNNTRIGGGGGKGIGKKMSKIFGVSGSDNGKKEHDLQSSSRTPICEDVPSSASLSTTVFLTDEISARSTFSSNSLNFEIEKILRNNHTLPNYNSCT